VPSPQLRDCFVIAVQLPFSFIWVLILRMWACTVTCKSSLLITDAISLSILSGRGTLMSHLKIRRLFDKLYPDFWVGPGPAGTFWLWVQSSTVTHCLAKVGIGLGLSMGLYCYSDCCLTCSLGLGLGLGFGCCCSWCFSGSLPSLAPA